MYCVGKSKAMLSQVFLPLLLSNIELSPCIIKLLRKLSIKIQYHKK